MSSAATESEPHDPYAAMKIPGFRAFFVGNVLFLFGLHMQSAAVSWELYERTNSELFVVFIGLAQVFPPILLALPAGQIVDRIDRRLVILVSLGLFILAAIGLAALSFFNGPIWCVFTLLIVNGIARAFQQPAKSSLVPSLVPRSVFASAVAWNTTGFHFAMVVGPALCGFVLSYLGGAIWVYVAGAALALVFCLALSWVPPQPPIKTTEPVTMKSLLAGVNYLLKTRLLLGAITLDLFAVLLGGATGLLPVFAKTILHVGPSEYGLLAAAQGIGALLMSFAMAHCPPLRRAGPALLWSVAAFGLATIGFGFARTFWLAWAMLFLTGVFDMVSVVVRHTLMQLWTPEEMRGRVSAVNGLFISMSNEMGRVESGFVAYMFHRPSDLTFGPTVSVVSGGFGTLLVVVLSAFFFPEIARHGRLDAGPPKNDEEKQTPS